MAMHRLRPPHPPPSTQPVAQPVAQIQQQAQQAHQQQAHFLYRSEFSKSPAPPVSQDQPAAPRTAACNLDLLSDAALASEVNGIQPLLNTMRRQSPSFARPRSYADPVTAGFTDRPRDDQAGMQNTYAPQAPQPSYDDYSLFLDDVSSPPHFLPPHFDPDQQLNFMSRSPNAFHRGTSKPGSQMPSRFGSLAPEGREPGDGGPRLEPSRSSPLRISAVDHSVLKSRLEEFSSVLPADFVFPSRHTLTRFFEGYITGFHEHLPMLHLPTLSPVEMAPELLLAVLAVGAQYRFESNRGYALWYAAKAVAMEQVRRRHSFEVHALLPTASSYSPHSTRPSPSATYRHSFASAQSERPTTQDTHREPYSPNTPQARLETIQAVLLLFSVGLWGAKTVLNEALSLQSNLAILIREEGLTSDANQAPVGDWEAWIRREGATRTKLIAYSFFNLCSIAYDLPPLLVTSELNLPMPLPSRLWRAATAWHWQELRQSLPAADITVHEAMSRLFGQASQQGLPTHLSSLGFYVLIHALIQHIYLLKQTSLAAPPQYRAQRALRPEDVDEVTQALRVWQAGMEAHHNLLANGPSSSSSSSSLSSSGPASASASSFPADPVPGGSLAHNATAMLRLAYIRLYTDVLPCRPLQSRDVALVASAMMASPQPMRSLRLHRAAFQAVHALSTLVKAGVNYVARTKASNWSVQHSLCNFECALILAKWLLTMAALTAAHSPISPEEKSLLDTVRMMLDETEFAVPVDPSLGGAGQGGGRPEAEATSDAMRLRQLASAVLRLWAETFKGTHVFEMVRMMGGSLDGYADLVDKERDRMDLGT
ncbi:hypothetical protein ESCO_005658 [Escovopsis weberi]|uniref:Xylanolytic transcriptional activator regulatory domain-containing protein n=1 Tax=Escovopsis weberi TaxID=150374 RepID=A0A0M8MUT3_ESCWE|nr:hypothetical protein ESCO_005658 [Escovopsis weberi]